MSAVTTEIRGDLARVAFPNDEAANKIFKAVLGNISTKQRDGAWEVALPTDNPKFRDQVVTRVEKAALAVEPRMQELAAGAERATELAAIIKNELGEQFAPNISVQARDSSLAIRIPPVQDAIEGLKHLGASWVRTNDRSPENGGYWQLPIKAPDSTVSASIHEERLFHALAQINFAVISHDQNRTLAATLGSPHPEIQLATRDDRLYVTTPSMDETNAVLKADGPGKMTWNNSAKAYAVHVTADNIDDVTKRLADIGHSYDTALIPPYAGKPGVIVDDPTAVILATKTPDDYAKDPSVRRAVTSFNLDVEKALTADERAALLSNNSSGNERIAALLERSPTTLPYIAKTITTAAAIERDGELLAQQANTREHAKHQGVSR